MIRRALLLAATLLVTSALVTGCAARPVEPRTAAAPATTTIAPVVTPSAVPGEVTLSTVSGGAVADPVGRTPARGQLAVEVACSGVDGSTMSWSLDTGDGKPLGLTGDADCTGPASTSWLGITSTTRPATVRVTLLPASGVVSGYAIVRSGTP